MMTEAPHDAILNSVRTFQDQWEEGHVAAGPATRFSWREEPNFPIDRIAGKHNIVQYFERDQKAWAEDGDPGYYDDMLNEPIQEPVIVVQIGGLAYLWDGNHRIAASILTGRTTIPAYVGTPLKIPT